MVIQQRLAKIAILSRVETIAISTTFLAICLSIQFLKYMAFSQNEYKRSYVPQNIAAVTFWHKLASVNGNTTAFSKDRCLIKGSRR
jgi:hypothetical protein